MRYSILVVFFILSNFAFAQNSKLDGTLPVELVYFYAETHEPNIVLYWGTATEINNYGYFVERGKNDSTVFEQIGFMEGHGTSYSPKDYVYTDTSLTESGTYYYRLMQVDTDGNIEYTHITHSDIVTTVEIEHQENQFDYKLKQNFPNPFNPATIISFSLAKESDVQLIVYDITGREVQKLINSRMSAGPHNKIFDASSACGGLSSGIYFYSLITENYRFTKKMILQK